MEQVRENLQDGDPPNPEEQRLYIRLNVPLTQEQIEHCAKQLPNGGRGSCGRYIRQLIETDMALDQKPPWTMKSHRWRVNNQYSLTPVLLGDTHNAYLRGLRNADGKEIQRAPYVRHLIEDDMARQPANA